MKPATVRGWRGLLDEPLKGGADGIADLAKGLRDAGKRGGGIRSILVFRAGRDLPIDHSLTEHSFGSIVRRLDKWRGEEPGSGARAFVMSTPGYGLNCGETVPTNTMDPLGSRRHLARPIDRLRGMYHITDQYPSESPSVRWRRRCLKCSRLRSWRLPPLD